MAQDWNKVIEEARAEIESNEIKIEALRKRNEHLKKAILVAEPLANEMNYPTTFSGITSAILNVEAEGITAACREVLRSSDKFMSPLSVRSAIEARGLDLSKQSNAMASVHTVLKRLKAKGEVVARTATDGGTVYKWRRSWVRHVAMNPTPAPTPCAIPGEPTPAPIPTTLKDK